MWKSIQKWHFKQITKRKTNKEHHDQRASKKINERKKKIKDNKIVEWTNKSEVKIDNLKAKLTEAKDLTWHRAHDLRLMEKMTNSTEKMQHQQHHHRRKSISQHKFVAVILMLIGLLHGVHCEIGN